MKTVLPEETVMCLSVNATLKANRHELKATKFRISH